MNTRTQEQNHPTKRGRLSVLTVQHWACFLNEVGAPIRDRASNLRNMIRQRDELTARIKTEQEDFLYDIRKSWNAREESEARARYREAKIRAANL